MHADAGTETSTSAASSSAGKERGPEFTSADEEVLVVLFASQAATAIANAVTHRDERRARADLEA